MSFNLKRTEEKMDGGHRAVRLDFNASYPPHVKRDKVASGGTQPGFIVPGAVPAKRFGEKS